MNAHELERHVWDLCVEHEIGILYDAPPGNGEARRRERFVRIAPIGGPITYLVALHEIAHVIGPEQTSRHRRIVQEIAAWELALELCRIPLTREMRLHVHKGLSAYVQSYFWHRRAWLPSKHGDPYSRSVWERMEKLLRLGVDSTPEHV